MEETILSEEEDEKTEFAVSSRTSRIRDESVPNFSILNLVGVLTSVGNFMRIYEVHAEFEAFWACSPRI